MNHRQPSLYEMKRAWQREQERQSGKTATCSGCGAPLLWIQMGERKDGRPGGRMPVDPAWRYGNGRRNLVVLDEAGRGKLLVKPGEDMLGREPHWGTCPNRKQFKRRGGS